MGRTVLIVEDEHDSRELLASLVGICGYEVEVARDGLEALDVLGRVYPCVVLLDLMMPRMNGWELRARMLANPSLAGIPVVVLSGIADIEASVGELDAQAAFSKPVDPDRLLDTIQQYC